MNTKYYSLTILVFLTLLLASCALQTTPLPTINVSPSLEATVAPTQSPTPTHTPTPTSVPLPTIQTNCTDSALYVEDVTIPDNTNLKPGESFTKIWRLRNTGKCIWNIRYALVFVGGDQMGGVVTTPLSETTPGETLDISVNLVAPTNDGAYTGLYELRSPKGQAIAIGLVTSIWVKITVGDVRVVPAAPPASQQTAPVSATSAPCSSQQNGAYTAQILSLINSARAEEKLGALTSNAQLTTAAQAHSDDMACNNFLAHYGSNGSSVHQRVVAAGYNPSYSEEIIFASGVPQDAFNWWMNDKIHRDAILNRNVKDIGVGYTYVSGSAYGGYYTVDFAAP